MVMYEIWSLGHKPFEDFSPEEVCHIALSASHPIVRIVDIACAFICVY